MFQIVFTLKYSADVVICIDMNYGRKFELTVSRQTPPIIYRYFKMTGQFEFLNTLP